MQTILPGYYTIEEATQALGYKSKSTLTTKAREGKIPCYRVSKVFLFPAYWVEEEVKKGPPLRGAGRGKPKG